MGRALAMAGQVVAEHTEALRQERRNHAPCAVTRKTEAVDQHYGWRVRRADQVICGAVRGKGHSDPRRIIGIMPHFAQVIVSVANAVVRVTANRGTKGEDDLILGGGIGDAGVDGLIM